MHSHLFYFSSRLTITSQRSNREDEPVNIVHEGIGAGLAGHDKSATRLLDGESLETEHREDTRH
jgi:hypothetical protein